MNRCLVYLLALAPVLNGASFGGAYRRSLRADFTVRDALPETSVPRDQWATCCWIWGPPASSYPTVEAPREYNAVLWKRSRVIEVAKHYLGLPYRHFHIPKMGGLDCSNFTSWVYNYGLGISMVSNVHLQAEAVGRRLDTDEKLLPGDLIYIWSEDHTVISHVAIYIDADHIIDSTSGRGSVGIRDFRGWYKDRYAWARRIVE